MSYFKDAPQTTDDEKEELESIPVSREECDLIISFCPQKKLDKVKSLDSFFNGLRFVNAYHVSNEDNARTSVGICWIPDRRRLFSDNERRTISKVIGGIVCFFGSEDFRIEMKEEESDDNFMNLMYRYGGLMVRNINSGIDIEHECIGYMNEIVGSWLSEAEAQLPTPTDPIFLMMPFQKIIPHIPILLLKEEDMPTYKEMWKSIEGKDKDDYMPKGIFMGYYSRDDKYDKEKKLLCKGPHIGLCPELIMKSAEASNIPFKILMAKVLVHEIAHAIMDNYIGGDPNQNRPDTLEAKAMEESLANAITLHVFDKYAKDNYKYVHHFVDNWQPTIYRFGLWQEKIDADWGKWREASKRNTNELKELFNKCFNGGNIRITKENYTPEIFEAVFP
jgi:hypothetical protein